MADSEQPVPTPASPAKDRNGPGLANGDPAHEGIVGQPGTGASAEGDVGVLGEASAAVDQPLHPPEAPALDLRSLRPGQFLSILNSTSFGQVISERQLLRDRHRAGLISSRNRIDLLQYAAWLRHERSNATASSNPYHEFKARRRQSSRRNGATPSHDDVYTLLEQQQYRCALTGQPLTPETASLDHMLPVCRNGPHTIGNAQIVLKEVNRAKRTLTNEEFITLCRAVVAHADRNHSSRT